MKTAVALIVLMVGGMAGIYYASCYVMGGIEAGMPGGGNGHYADYHQDNAITSYFGGGSVNEHGFASQSTPGDVTANPFAE